MERPPYPKGQTPIDLDALRDKLMGIYGFAARYTEDIDGVPITMTIDEYLEAFGNSMASLTEVHMIRKFKEMAERALSLDQDDPAGFDRSLVAGSDALKKFIADRRTE